MQRRILAAAIMLCAGSATAQNPLHGFMYNWDRPAAGDALSIFVRWGLTSESVLARIDRSDYPEWGVNATGDTQIQGFMTWINDANDTTVEQFNLVGFEESTTLANFPDMTTPRMNVGPIPMPPTGVPAGNRAWRLSATLTLPVTFAASKDVFLGLGLPAAISGTPPFDALFVGSVNPDPLMAPFPFDQPGPRGLPGAAISQDSYVCYVPTAQPPRYVPSGPVSLEQLAFDVHVSGGSAGGTALATTPQANYATSNILGTTNFISGLHPDIARGDNIGMALTTHTAQAPAAFGLVLLGFAPSPFGSIPITSIPGLDPTSGGNLCIDTTTALSFFVVMNPGQLNSLANMVEGQFVFPLSPADRALIASQPGNFDIWWQGFVVDATNPVLEVHATGCVIQHVK